MTYRDLATGATTHAHAHCCSSYSSSTRRGYCGHVGHCRASHIHIHPGQPALRGWQRSEKIMKGVEIGEVRLSVRAPLINSPEYNF